MKQVQGPLKAMLPGLIPLFIFIIAEAIWGVKIGLVVALTVGVGELIFGFIKNKTFDKFILVDTALLVVFGMISILLEKDIFFKLKPAFMELILMVIVGISAFGKWNPILAMSKRYMKGIEFTATQDKQMKIMMRDFFFLLAFHIALIIYAAYYLSNAMWGFISGILFYVILFGYMAFVILKQRFKAHQLTKEEQLPIVNSEGELKGKAPRSICHNGEEKPLHPVIHLHVLNDKNELFLQKRPMNKLVAPGLWDTAVGGHISYGETIEIAMKREAKEEIGLQDFKAQLIHRYQWNSSIESELVFVFLTHDFESISIPTQEVPEGKFWSRKEIEQNIGKGKLTDNFEQEYKLICEKLNEQSH